MTTAAGFAAISASVAAFLLVSVLLLWLLSIRIRDVSIIDLAYALLVAGAAVVAVALGNRGPLQGLLLFALGAWALRFTVFILRRNLGKGEDPRYTKLRSWAADERAFNRLDRRSNGNHRCRLDPGTTTVATLAGEGLPVLHQQAGITDPLQPGRIRRQSLLVPANKGEAKLLVRGYPLRVDILHGDDVIASHLRCYGKDQDIYNPLHYLPLLEQRPGAFQHAKPVRRWRASWPPVYERLLAKLQTEEDRLREFVRILKLHQEYPAQLVEQAVTQALGEKGERSCSGRTGGMPLSS